MSSYVEREESHTCEQNLRPSGRKEIAAHFGSESIGRKTDLPTVLSFFVLGWHLAEESSLLQESHFKWLC